VSNKFPVQVVISAVDKITGPLSAIQKKLETLNKPIAKVGAAMTGVTGAAAGLATQLGILGGIAGVGLYKVTTGAAEAGDAIDEAAQKAGVGAEALQKLAYAASFSSISQDQLVGTLGKLNANIVSATQGSKSLGEAFAFAGIGAAELKRLKPEEVLARIADKIQSLESDDPRRGALAKALLGKSGQELIPFLAAGAAGIKELGDEAQSLGLILSEKDIANAVRFSDSFDRARKVIGGLTRAVGAGLLPVIEPLLVRFVEFIKLNRGLINQKISEWVNGFARALAKIDWQRTFAGIESFFTGIGKAIDFVGGLGNALGILLAIMAGPLLLALGSLTTALYGLGAAIFAIPGVGWALALASAFVLLYNKSEAFKAAIDGVWDAMQKIAGFILPDWLKKIFSGNGASVNINQNQQPAANPTAQNTQSPTVSATAAARQAVAAGQTGQVAVDVNFSNMPRGTEVKPSKAEGVKLNLGMGYAMGGV
jgi:hypothetical protein